MSESIAALVFGMWLAAFINIVASRVLEPEITETEFLRFCMERKIDRQNCIIPAKLTSIKEQRDDR